MSATTGKRIDRTNRETISRDVARLMTVEEAGVNPGELWVQLLVSILDETSSKSDLSRQAAEIGRFHARGDDGIESMIRDFLIARDFVGLRIAELLSDDAYSAGVRSRIDCALAAAVSALTEVLLSRSRHDGVTGLADRVAFDLALAEEIERASRYETAFTLVMFDLDNFKSVNDRFGHVEGDRVLRSAASTIVRALRRSDRVFRFGGDEFAAICLGDASRGIARAIGRIEEAMADVAITSGAAVFPVDARDALSLVRVADQRMFAGKKQRKGTEGTET